MYKSGDEVGRMELRNEALERHNREIDASLLECKVEGDATQERLAGAAAEAREARERRERLTRVE